MPEAGPSTHSQALLEVARIRSLAFVRDAGVARWIHKRPPTPPRRKRLLVVLAAVAALALAAATGAVVASAQSSSGVKGSDLFDDIPEGHWADEAVGRAVTTGITTGTSDTEFSPNDTLNRAQMVTFLHRFTNLLVLADFDVIKQQLVNARLADGTPIPVATLKDLALEANIVPSIFDAKTQQMWLGRTRRTASEAQRMALIARDEHCIGCEANPLWCRAHHIVWWSNNGRTDFDNLLLVCDACHQKIHIHGWEVHQHPDTKKFQLKPPPQPEH